MFRSSKLVRLGATALVPAAVMVVFAWAQPPSRQKAPAPVPGEAGDDAAREAILKSAREFAAAFNKGDAKSIATMWTQNGESREADGHSLVGRAAIEKAFADFFTDNAGAKIEVLVKSVRFPAKELAVEEGLLRQSRGAKEMPTTTSYVAIHVREDGQWRIALSSESGVGQDRLEDLDWLLGDWTTKVREETVKMSFARDPAKPLVTATITRSALGRDTVSGRIRIAFDPETGQIRSWSFEDDGAHSQSLWHNDGKSWILDSRGVLANGTPTAERILLQRVDPNVMSWRSVDRVVGEIQLGDTAPMRFTRASAKE